MTIIKHVPTLNKTAAFIDRDGVINKEVLYCHKISDFQFVEGIFSLLRVLQNRFDVLVIVTNQAGIARGYYTESQFNVLTTWMLDELEKEGIYIDSVLYCPHHVDGRFPYDLECCCRKPEPGMINKALMQYGINSRESLIIGDKISDIQAGINAGLGKRILVGTGHSVTERCISEADHYYETHIDLIADIDNVVKMVD